MSQTLAYGDIIRIYCSLQDNQEGNKIGGFLMSKGFADANIYFLKSKLFTEFELRNSLFEVLPYSSFEIHDQAKKIRQEAKSKGLQPSISENMKSSMKTQEQQFRSKSIKQRKMQINFDSEVVIKHVNSNSYLQGEFSCPETGIGSFKLILSQDLSSDVKFKITRFRNSDKQTQQIQSKDEFIIYHCSSHCYLNIGDLTEKIFLDKQIKIISYEGNTSASQLARQDNEAYKYYNQRPLIKSPNDGGEKIERYEVVNMSKPTLILNFLVEKSSKDQVAQSEIQHNDIVYIRNTKNNSYLTANLWSGQVSMVSYTGEKSGIFPYQGIWEVSVPRNIQKGQVSNIKTYFLKHYITDKVCKIHTVDSKLKRLQLDSGMSHIKDFKTFKIVSYQQKKTLNHRDLIFLQKCESTQQTIVHGSFQIHNYDKSNPSYLDIGDKIQKIYRSKLQQKCQQNSFNYSMQLTEGPLVNAFQIFKLQEKKLKQINKILSCVQILTNFCDVLIVSDNIIRKQMLKSPPAEEPIPQASELSRNMRYSSIISSNGILDLKAKHKSSMTSASEKPQQIIVDQLLSEYLNYYILNLVIKTIDYLFQNIKKPSKKPDFDFMIMIRSLGLIQILVQAVFFIQRNLTLIKTEESSQISKYLKKKKYLRDRLEDCFKKIYHLLYELSQQNSCRLHLGKWFNMFMNQFYTLKYDYIHSLIIDLLKEKFIIKTIKQSDIQQCIRNMSTKEGINSSKNFKYLDLLSSFCRTKNTNIYNHQKFIMGKLKAYPSLFYTFLIDDTKNIDFEDQGFVEKGQICFQMNKTSHILENFQGEKWIYIIYLLNLYADLIFDYPFDKIQEVQRCIDMKTVKAFFEKKDYFQKKDNDISIVDSFLKLAQYFFINKINQCKEPYSRIDKQQTLHILCKKQVSELPNNQLNEIFKEYSPVIKFIIHDILAEERKMKNYNLSRLKTLQTSLELLKNILKTFSGKLIDQALQLIIDVVIKLKRNVIYQGKNVQKCLQDISSRIIEYGEEVIRNYDKEIDKNSRKLLSSKPMQRLLIDTRSQAGQILNIRLNFLINQGLQQLNQFFTDVCQNKISIEQYNRPSNNKQTFYGSNSHWIWINKIIQITNNTINRKLNNLTNKRQNGKNVLIKLLIECMFVESLKIVNKIMMLIFRLYEFRKTLMVGFKDTFVVQTDCFANIVQLNNRWINDFQKSKTQQKKNQVMNRLQITSLAIRFFELKKVQKAFIQLKNGLPDQEILNINKELRQGLSQYIVLNQRQTQLSTNQILLQKMIGNQKIHNHVISFIKTLKEGAPNYTQNLNIAYEFLTLLIYNNARNKKMLTKDVKIALSHITSNCRSIQFMKKLIIQNQNIINNRQLVSELVTSIIEAAHSIDGDQQKLIIKAKLIQSLRVFCVFQGKNHLQNQTLIMIQLQNKKYDESIMFSTIEYTKNKDLNDDRIGLFRHVYKMGRQDFLMKGIQDAQHMSSDSFENCIDEIQKTPSSNFKKYPEIYYDFMVFRQRYNEAISITQQRGQKQNQRNQLQQNLVLDIPPSLMYLAAFFSTMCALVQGDHEINKGKCSNMHPYDSLIQILNDIAKCFPVARHARAYLIKLYFSGSFSKKAQKTKFPTKNANPTTNSIRNSSRAGSSTSRQGTRNIQNFLTKLFIKQIVLLCDRLRSINNDLLNDQSLVYRLRIKTPIRYQYMGSYLYCLMQEILYQIYVFFEKLQDYAEEPSSKSKRLSKEESFKLKQLFKLLGTTYQLLTKSGAESTSKKLIQNIYMKCTTIIKILDLQQEHPFSKMQIQKKIFNKNKVSYDYQKLKSSSFPTKEQYYNFMAYYFFLSCQEENRLYIQKNNQNIEDLKENAIMLPSESIKKSFIKKLIPSKFYKQQEAKVYLNSQQSKKMRKTMKQLESPDKQIRLNKILQVTTEDLIQREQSYLMVQQEINELVKLCCSLDQPEFENESGSFGFQRFSDFESDTDNKMKDSYRIIGYNKFMSNIIELVTKSPNHLTLKGKIKTIKLIRLIFQNKVNTECKVEDKQWDSGLFQNENLISLKKIQNQFKSLNLDKMIVAILKKQIQSYHLLSQTFKLGIKFLYNGNSQCQGAILNNLKQDPENMVIVQLFNFIKKMRLQISQGKFNIKVQDQQQKTEQNFRQSILDTFHYFDIQNKCMSQLGAEKDNSREFEEQVKMKIKCVCRGYQFLQLLCQNDNRMSKNFLRQQTNLNGTPKYNSINFISQTSKLFKVVLENYTLNQDQNNILKFLADFFIQVTQLPCTDNQLELCSTSIFSDIRAHAINPDNRFNNQNAGPQKITCALLDFVINAGLSLLQGSSPEIYKSLISSLDKEFIYCIFKYQQSVLEVLNRKKSECPLINQFDDQTLKILLTDNPENAIIKKRIYMVYNLFALIEKLSKYVRQNKTQINDQPLITKLIQYIQDMEPKKSVSIYPEKPNDQSSITIQNFCEIKLRHIEVVFQEKKQYLYFPDLPIFKKLTDETKQQILQNIKRDTQVDKITDFLVKSSQINNLMNWNYKIQEKLSLSVKTLEWIRLNILFLTLTIVGLYIIFTTVSFIQINGKIKMLKSIDNPIIQSIVNILCVFHLFSSIYFVFTWCTLKYRMPIEQQYKSHSEEQVRELLRKIDADAPFQLKDYYNCIRILLKNSKEIYSIILFFIVFSLMGYFVGIQWYSMLVFDMITRNKILKNVIQAITSNLQQLLVVSLLILAFVFVFNIMSIEFSLYLPIIYENQDQKCTVLSDCVISLYNSGEIGQKHKQFKFSKFFADLLYVVIMELLFSNIVSGIVIDTFAQLRDQRKTIQTDTITKCFICGISKATFEKQLKQEEDILSEDNQGLKGFERHVKIVHSQWNYIYYLYILSEKDITTYTGIEYYIKNQKQHDQYDWIPTYKEDDDMDIKQILEITQRIIPKIKEKLQNRNELTN